MASLAKSQKGFKRLEDYELLEVKEGNSVEDSGSETELLNLSTATIKKSRRGTQYSCGRYKKW